MNTTVQPITFKTLSQRVEQAIVRQLRAMLDTVRRTRRRSKLLRELQGLDDHMLRDIGVHRAELPSVVAELVGSAPATRRQVLASQQVRP